MKQILVAPIFINNENIRQISANTFLSDYLLQEDYLPVIPAFYSQFKNKEQVTKIAEEYIKNSDALILQGGQSIGGEESRDLFEKVLLEFAIKKCIPILGLCRGLQIINVFFEGTLKKVENIELHLIYKNKNADDMNFNTVDLSHRHELSIIKDSFLNQNLNKITTQVNSAHEQGIDILGNGLQIEAKSEDDLIEAISNVEKKILAVQWHPEMDLNNSDSKLIIDSWLRMIK
jgi:putative glutamine amidotransferase